MDEFTERLNYWKGRATNGDTPEEKEGREVIAFYNQIGVLPRWSMTMNSLLPFAKEKSND